MVRVLALLSLLLVLLVLLVLELTVTLLRRPSALLLTSPSTRTTSAAMTVAAAAAATPRAQVPSTERRLPAVWPDIRPQEPRRTFLPRKYLPCKHDGGEAVWDKGSGGVLFCQRSTCRASTMGEAFDYVQRRK